MKKYKLTFCLSILVIFCHAQHQHEITVMYYNSENFFDSTSVVSKNQQLPFHLSHVKIVVDSLIEKYQLPALVGVYEIEQKKVTEKLNTQFSDKNVNYGVINIFGNNSKSFDTGLLYNKNLFSLVESEALNTTLPELPDDKSCNILYVNLNFKQSENIHVFVMHMEHENSSGLLKEKHEYAYQQLINRIELLKTKNNDTKILILGAEEDLITILSPVNHSEKYESKFRSPKSTYNPKEQWRSINQIILSQALLNNKKSLHLDGQTSQFGEEKLLKNNDFTGLNKANVKSFLAATLLTLQY